MDRKRRTLRWIAFGIFAASVFAAASPAQARDGWSRHGSRPRVRVSISARPFFPHVRYSHFYRPYYYAANPYYADSYFYASSPYYYGSPYYYARPYSYGVRRAYRPHVVFRHGQFRHRF
jgi:hypothetical protein